MRRYVWMAALAAVGAAVVTTGASALPGPSPVAGAENDLVQKARVYCYNRYTGRFLYWGYCRRPSYVYRRPGRVYCYNRYTGRFLHWGSCYR